MSLIIISAADPVHVGLEPDPMSHDRPDTVYVGLEPDLTSQDRPDPASCLVKLGLLKNPTKIVFFLHSFVMMTVFLAIFYRVGRV